MTQVPPPVTAPVCYRHPSRETYVRCVRCDRPICPDCMNEASVGFQCPECVSEGRRTQRPARTAFGGGIAGEQGYVTKGLIAANVVMALLSALSAGDLRQFLGNGLFGGITPLLEWGGVWGLGVLQNQATGAIVGTTPAGVADGEFYRLFTAMFLHYGVVHLLLNMWALWIFGRALEAALGPARFLALYLLAGLGGNVAAYLFQPEALTAGASTAVYGLFGALFVVLKRLRRDTSSLIPIIVINVVFTFAAAGRVSIAGHLGGLAIGTLVALGLAYAPRERRNALQLASIGATLLILGGLTIVQTIALNS
ncbi:rhomboid family intramembrane serine protease [Luedemannella helvata]|uniref:Rhomboid family intramembrane serine protease n=1 Tax=Luedemannella helvata TaxID=349315 RepID=A0ABP4W8U0_9ACTN